MVSPKLHILHISIHIHLPPQNFHPPWETLRSSIRLSFKTPSSPSPKPTESPPSTSLRSSTPPSGDFSDDVVQQIASASREAAPDRGCCPGVFRAEFGREEESEDRLSGGDRLF
ncbi:unnamed protein product [Citrullus colocynthis]|uniref:Uncharacterized protein n=1 Tax=Citrullus colocynthis TaxID=252529 RepID=A0ABP0Y5W6_9ROSI